MVLLTTESCRGYVPDYSLYNNNDCSETHLRKLLTQQRKQIDEIKKATNYYSTKTLIERYDEPGGGSPSVSIAGSIESLCLFHSLKKVYQ